MTPIVLSMSPTSQPHESAHYRSPNPIRFHLRLELYCRDIYPPSGSATRHVISLSSISPLHSTALIQRIPSTLVLGFPPRSYGTPRTPTTVADLSFGPPWSRTI